MRGKDFLPILPVLLFGAAACYLHGLALFLMGKEPIVTEFLHSIRSVYAFFMSCSVVILLILIVVRQKNIDSVGQVFMLLTCLKMGLAYAFEYAVLQESDPVAYFEKMNFFIVFALFLTLETVLSIRVLNKR